MTLLPPIRWSGASVTLAPESGDLEMAGGEPGGMNTLAGGVGVG